jgi:hypothetical protein
MKTVNVELWNGNNLLNIQKLLDYILSIWLQKGGYELTTKNYIAFDEFLASLKPNSLNRSAVHKTLTEMKASALNSFNDFKVIYSRYFNELTKKESIKKKWSFYIPINAEFEDDITFPIAITILEKKYSFVSNLPFANKIHSNFPDKLWDYKAQVKNHVTNPKMVFLAVSTLSKDVYSAWKNIAQSFDTLRGIIDFTFGFRSIEIGSESRQRTKIPHPRWALIRHQANYYEGITFHIPDYKTDSKLKFSKKILRRLKTILDLLKKYLLLILQNNYY